MKSNNVSDFSEIIDVITLWSNVLFAVFLVIAVIFAIWKLIFILVSIMRSADSPEERANYLSALKFPIGAIFSQLVAIFVIWGLATGFIFWSALWMSFYKLSKHIPLQLEDSL